MRNFLLGLLPAMVVLGCAKEIERETDSPKQEIIPLTADEIRFLAERRIPTKFDSCEIDRIVADAISLLENGASTRSASTRSARGIRPVTTIATANDPTRSAVTRDTIFHIVDFADGEGYCVIAADRRLPDEIICLVGHGSFPASFPDGPIENPGLALMMDAARIYALRSLDSHRTWCDSVETALLTRTGITSLDLVPATQVTRSGIIAEPYEPTWRFHRRVGPLLPVEWSQGAPFNATVVENTPWSRTPVGCVALAAVQVMAYWKHPRQLQGLAYDNIDWNELRRWSGPHWNRQDRYAEWEGPMSQAPEETRKLIADILWHVGGEVDMNYGPSNSTAYTYRAVNLLVKSGFSKARTVSYSQKDVLGSIDARRPVMIDAASHETEDGRSQANAHAWVIDGYLEERWWDAFHIDHHLYEIERFRGYFHSNFGWGGTDNGWYACGLFDANNGPHLPSNTRAEWVGDHYNYQFMQTVYVDIFK